MGMQCSPSTPCSCSCLPRTRSNFVVPFDSSHSPLFGCLLLVTQACVKRRLAARVQEAKQTGALQAAKGKLEKQLEEASWRLDLEKRMRVRALSAASVMCQSAPISCFACFGKEGRGTFLSAGVYSFWGLLPYTQWSPHPLCWSVVLPAAPALHTVVSSPLLCAGCAGWSVGQADLEDIRDKQAEELEGLREQLDHAKAEVERSRKSVEALEKELAEHKAAAEAAAKEAQEATARAEEAQAAAASASAAAAAALAQGQAAAAPQEAVIKTVVKEVVRVVELPGSSAQQSGDTESLRATVSLGSAPSLRATSSSSEPTKADGMPESDGDARLRELGAQKEREVQALQETMTQMREEYLRYAMLRGAHTLPASCPTQAMARVTAWARRTCAPAGRRSDPRRCMPLFLPGFRCAASCGRMEEQMQNLERENQVLRKQALEAASTAHAPPGTAWPHASLAAAAAAHAATASQPLVTPPAGLRVSGSPGPSPPTGDTASDASTPAPLALARVLGPSPAQMALTPAVAPAPAMLVAPATAPPATGAAVAASPTVPSPLPSDATQRRMRQILDKQAVSGCCVNAVAGCSDGHGCAGQAAGPGGNLWCGLWAHLGVITCGVVLRPSKIW